MPRPSLTEEMEDAMGDVEWLLAQNARLRTRLTALETEIEGYRKEKQEGVGRSEGGASLRRRAGGLVLAVQPEGTASTIAQPSDLAASHPASLPCSSEYVNAQSGYDGETGR